MTYAVAQDDGAHIDELFVDPEQVPCSAPPLPAFGQTQFDAAVGRLLELFSPGSCPALESGVRDVLEAVVWDVEQLAARRSQLLASGWDNHRQRTARIWKRLGALQSERREILASMNISQCEERYDENYCPNRCYSAWEESSTVQDLEYTDELKLHRRVSQELTQSTWPEIDASTELSLVEREQRVRESEQACTEAYTELTEQVTRLTAQEQALAKWDHALSAQAQTLEDRAKAQAEAQAEIDAARIHLKTCETEHVRRSQVQAEEEAELAALRTRLASAENSLACREDAASSLESTLSQREHALSAREQDAASSLESMLSQREHALSAREQELASLSVALSAREAAAAEHEDAWSSHHAALRTEQRELVSREKDIDAKESTLVEFHALVAQRQEALDVKEAAVAARENAVVEREAALAQREQRLTSGEDTLCARPREKETRSEPGSRKSSEMLDDGPIGARRRRPTLQSPASSQASSATQRTRADSGGLGRSRTGSGGLGRSRSESGGLGKGLRNSILRLTRPLLDAAINIGTLGTPLSTPRHAVGELFGASTELMGLSLEVRSAGSPTTETGADDTSPHALDLPPAASPVYTTPWPCGGGGDEPLCLSSRSVASSAPMFTPQETATSSEGESRLSAPATDASGVQEQKDEPKANAQNEPCTRATQMTQSMLIGEAEVLL